MMEARGGGAGRPGDTGMKRNLQILATMALLDDAPASRGGVFANVLEFNDQALLLESCRSLEEGTRVEVSFFVPGAGANAFEKVSMTCLIGRTRNSRTLHYEAEILSMDEASRRNFSACLSTSKSYEESIS